MQKKLLSDDNTRPMKTACLSKQQPAVFDLICFTGKANFWISRHVSSHTPGSYISDCRDVKTEVQRNAILTQIDCMPSEIIISTFECMQTVRPGETTCWRGLHPTPPLIFFSLVKYYWGCLRQCLCWRLMQYIVISLAIQLCAISAYWMFIV